MQPELGRLCMDSEFSQPVYRSGLYTVKASDKNHKYAGIAILAATRIPIMDRQSAITMHNNVMKRRGCPRFRPRARAYADSSNSMQDFFSIYTLSLLFAAKRPLTALKKCISTTSSFVACSATYASQSSETATIQLAREVKDAPLARRCTGHWRLCRRPSKSI
jgi:hypothetical protein